MEHVSFDLLWLTRINAIRISGHFWALTALIFLVSNTNFLQSLFIAFAGAAMQISVIYYCIYHLKKHARFRHRRVQAARRRGGRRSLRRHQHRRQELAHHQ